ncbi:protein of unknown function [Pseudomonas sp. JV551A1]|uniref:Uncharacterized protein n=1 Tax=Pseudomonas inefficax TaxID=2078786 RepID=A0AAQ1PCW4_9PSED|nr:protein of unknown function [Pseudomonas sp. JV551A1]SPO62781.1 protein of unknown function [Pseudomonas inefficax]
MRYLYAPYHLVLAVLVISQKTQHFCISSAVRQAPI